MTLKLKSVPWSDYLKITTVEIAEAAHDILYKGQNVGKVVLMVK